MTLSFFFNFSKYLTIILIFLLACKVFAWDSLGFNTHMAITDDAIKLINEAEYPDLIRFKNQIKYGSNSESHNSHQTDTRNSDNLNGGYPRAFWDAGKTDSGRADNAVFYYNFGEFTRCYFYFGKICHLISDMAVPAHAANILHGKKPFYFDNFETAADENYVFGELKPFKKNKDPEYYFKVMKKATYKNIKKHKWINEKEKMPYWLIDGDKNEKDSRGEYGGEYYLDIFDYTGKGAKNIIESQITLAINFTAGALMSMSEKLPARTSNITIEKSKDGYKISFEVQENRKPMVKIWISVDDKKNKCIRCENYSPKDKYMLEPGNEMPWEKVFEFYWDGKLHNGKYIMPGEHRISITVIDEDKNISQEAVKIFTSY
ncbi:MAG: hypothetical protein A2252_12155 [Elusimicrobia bacterium RIFOXYA2_FULL_39_19]|nr:MAG: hypothetical protein A2252_12155 [Elusimicrobia bacterium RIFOXYA2_FULL_39_19]